MTDHSYKIPYSPRKVPKPTPDTMSFLFKKKPKPEAVASPNGNYTPTSSIAPQPYQQLQAAQPPPSSPPNPTSDGRGPLPEDWVRGNEWAFLWEFQSFKFLSNGLTLNMSKFYVSRWIGWISARVPSRQKQEGMRIENICMTVLQVAELPQLLRSTSWKAS